MSNQKYKLSDRLRPGVECAPWVIDEVRKMEAERDALRARIEGAPVVHDVTGKLGFVGRDVALVLRGGDE